MEGSTLFLALSEGLPFFLLFFSIHMRHVPRLVGFWGEARERPSDLADSISLLIHRGFSFYKGYFHGFVDWNRDRIRAEDQVVRREKGGNRLAS